MCVLSHVACCVCIEPQTVQYSKSIFLMVIIYIEEQQLMQRRKKKKKCSDVSFPEQESFFLLMGSCFVPACDAFSGGRSF